MDGLAAVMVVMLTVGTLLGWLALLNRRDRQKNGLLNAVFRQLSSPELRGRIAVQVRSGVLSPRSLVAVDVLAASENEMWKIMARLAERLPYPVRIEVTGQVDPHFVTTMAVETTRGQARLLPSQPCAASD